MSQAFLDALQGLAAVEPARCAQPWSWEGRQGWPLAGRQALYLCLEAELGMAARREPGGEAAAAVRFAQTAFGDLRGLLAGVADSFLDSEPEPGAWTLRQVLGHVLLTERSYHRQVDYALRRADTDPIYLARASQLAPDEEGGGVRAWIDRLEAERALAAGLARTAVRLERPTQWAGYEVDLRFRLHRFTSHLIEHTIQVEAALAGLGWSPGEAARITRRVSAARGAHELFTAPAELKVLDQAHLARLASLG